MIVDVIGNGIDQGSDVVEGAPAQALVGDLSEPAFDHVQPGTGCGDEVQVETRLSFQPRLHAGMFMGPVVVHDQMQSQSGEVSASMCFRKRINS